ncbi:MAG: prepilin peptidase [Coprobacillus cateniformis]|uniref:prepilin peptidase n=1 Tax=Longibaculum muris TaxID=1796628 RepID=UPI003AB51540|nr:prepilin peptidase [Coprobacillus cateniformis]
MIDLFILIIVMLLSYIFNSCYFVYEMNDRKEKINIKNALQKNLYNLIFASHAFVLGLIGGVCFYYYNYSFIGLYKYYMLLEILLLLVIIDIKKKVIPNFVLLILLGVVLLIDLIQVFVYGGQLELAIAFAIGAGLAFIIFFICMLITRGGIGAGDVKLFTIIGLCSGFAITNIIFYSLCASFLYSIVLLMTRKAKMKDFIPMVPFIYLGVLIFFITSFI